MARKIQARVRIVQCPEARECSFLNTLGLAMKQWLKRTAIVLGTALLCAGLPAGKSASAQVRTDSLYKRLGGYDAIAAVADDFIGRLASDPKLARFFQGSSTASRRHRRQLLVEQLCEAAGGPCYYTGRSMKTSHQGLGITDAVWDVTVAHLLESLDKFQVPSRERQELIGIISSTKADIVEAGKTSGPPR